MDHLDQLEARSVHILREAYASFPSLCMLWSIGKDSTVMLWLARKAFFGHVPFPLVHIDTAFKIPEMIAYRDRLALEWRLQLIVGMNREALDAKRTFPDGAVDRITCCRLLKTEALRRTLSGEGERLRISLSTGKYEPDPVREPYTGVIVGARADEEGSRSKEVSCLDRILVRSWNIWRAQSSWSRDISPMEKSNAKVRRVKKKRSRNLVRTCGGLVLECSISQ